MLLAWVEPVAELPALLFAAPAAALALDAPLAPLLLVLVCVWFCA
jgi:hypothetical protein